MKKLFSFLLALCLLSALLPAALADGPAFSIKGETITVRDDGSGEDVDNALLIKRVFLTTRGIGYTVQSGPLSLTVNSVQLAEATAASDLAALCFPADKGVTLAYFCVDITIRNAGTAPFVFPGTSAAFLNGGRRVLCDAAMSDDITGLLAPGEEKTGQLIFMDEHTSLPDFQSFNIIFAGAETESGARAGMPIPVAFVVADLIPAAAGPTFDASAVEIKYGELLDVRTNGDILIVKAKISPSWNNSLTISQNYHNAWHLIWQFHDSAFPFTEVQYWAVADMTDGSEGKAVSFTVPAPVISHILASDYDLPDIEMGRCVTDLWILPSLQT